MKSLPPLPAAAKPGQRLDLPPYAPSADTLALAELAQPGRLLVAVTASPLEAQRLAEEVAWFAPDLKVHLLPDWETLPYDSFSPHQDLVSERLASVGTLALAVLMTSGLVVLQLTPHDAAGKALAPPVLYYFPLPSENRATICA